MCFPSKAKVWGQWSFLVLGWREGLALLSVPQGPCSLSQNCNITAAFPPAGRPWCVEQCRAHSTALSLSLSGSTSHLPQPARPPQPLGCAPGHSSSGGHPGCRPRKAQSWRGDRAKATVAMGPFRVEVQLWPSATAEPSQWAGLGEAPPHQCAVALRATHHSSSQDRWE